MPRATSFTGRNANASIIAANVGKFRSVLNVTTKGFECVALREVKKASLFQYFVTENLLKRVYYSNFEIDNYMLNI